MPVSRKGKIARLSFAVREEVNARLLDNENGPDILLWLNAKCGLKGSKAINESNLSQWRGGGFEEWLEKQDKVDRTKRLAEYCLRMAEAGGGTMALPAAIAGGQLMEVLEAFDPVEVQGLLAEKPENWIGILESLAKLQKAGADDQKVKQNDKVIAQNDKKISQGDRKLALDEQRFQRQTCELFIKWYKDEKAREIIENKSGSPTVQMELLRELMFGAVEPDQRGYLEGR